MPLRKEQLLGLSFSLLTLLGLAEYSQNTSVQQAVLDLLASDAQAQELP